MTRTYPQQLRALKRAVATEEEGEVLAECRRAITEFRATSWPDNWSAWQRALDDIFPWPHIPQLDDL